MKEIKLQKGQIALVDDEDYDYLNQFTWRLTSDGRYATREQYNKGARTHITMHREIMGFPEELILDHIDRNTLNNQKSNLRLATKSDNAKNSRRHKDASTPYKGVSVTNKSYSRMSKKTGELRHYIYPDWYLAQISINGKHVGIGTFKTPEEAALAYDKKARELFGDFAYLNFPDPLKEAI